MGMLFLGNVYIPLLKIGISVLGPQIPTLFDVQVRFLRGFFHLIESKHGIKLFFVVNAFCFVSVTVL